VCGFVGLLRPQGLPQDIHAQMAALLQAIAHRGPDDDGLWVDASAGLALGHRRLSIMDLSPLGHQPMVSLCGRWVLAYNGEIYNASSLRRDLEAEGWTHGWRGHSDTETLLAAVATYGLRRAVEKSVGMFALALWDRSQRFLTLARDRLGEKPLYYGWLRDRTFAFTSDLGALFPHPQWEGEMNRDALALFMEHNYVPAPYTIFANISKLKPGHLLEIPYKTLEPTLTSYWEAAEKALQGQKVPFQGGAEEAVTFTESLIRQSLAGQMTADVPVGAFLSGGIDSSTIVALMQSMSPRPIHTFSIGFHETGYNEAVHAKAVAQHLGTHHRELYVSPQEMLDVIPKLPGMYTEPFADSSQIPTFLISQLARQSVTVCLSGDGGDELFAGYNRHAFSDTLWRRISLLPHPLRTALAALIRTLPPPLWDQLLTPLLNCLPLKYRLGNPGRKAHTLATILSAPSQMDLYKQLVSHWACPHALVLHSQALPTVLSDGEQVPGLASFVRKMMYMDLVSYLPDDILVKVDRASMASSLETRVPLLDHRLVEFSLSLPVSLLRRNGQSKWPLRQILYRYVPPALVERPKMGFGVPLDRWLRGPLRAWGEDLLHPATLKNQGYLHPPLVTEAWQHHQSGKQDLSFPLWNLLMFQAWLQQHSKPSPKTST